MIQSSSANTVSLVAAFTAQNLLPATHRKSACEFEQSSTDRFLRWYFKQTFCDHLAAAECIAEVAALTVVDLPAICLPESPDQLVSISLIKKHHVLPLRSSNNLLTLAADIPEKRQAIADIQFQTGKEINLVIAASDKLHSSIERTVRQHEFTSIRHQAHLLAHTGTELTTNKDLDPDDDRPVVRLVNQLLTDAVLGSASDVHLEPFEHTCRVRFRNDGVLHEAGQIPAQAARRIAARIKVMARMNVADRRLPQDGRLRLNVHGGKKVDFRVSSLPTIWGEKLVLRQLQLEQASLDIPDLGLEADQLQQLHTALQKSQGMILTTGPTGSGKSSTLYAALKYLNHVGRNIATAEDPVELPLSGINQVQINNAQGLSFASAIRAFLRQDPDVMMVGEIRDQETAEIVVKAAQTGHLILSTLHTNNAIESLSRLLSMGVRSFNLANSLSLVIAQRLLRKLCVHCKVPAQLDSRELEQEGIHCTQESSGIIYRASGCQRCHAGYRGRIGIYEVVPITPELSRCIMLGQESGQVDGYLQQAGIASLREAALRKVATGLTSLQEANRLT